MKAIAHDRYGSLDVLSLRELAEPSLSPDEVRVRVHAAGLHIGDCFAVRGEPFLMRLYVGLLRPRHGIPGFDLAGTVAAVGANVTDLKPGDEVYGCGFGTCAEYARARPEALAKKPQRLSFVEAAALPTSGVAALCGLRDAGKLRSGQRVLINGAAGGVGSLAVQIAKALGAEVTGVCSAKNVELVRSLGADQVIDYGARDFTKDAGHYDLILDNVENRSLAECRRALTPTGTLVLNSGTGTEGLATLVRLLKPLVLSPFVGQRLRRYVTAGNRADLLSLSELVEAGTLRPVIDRTFALAETRAALAYIETGHARGKVVVTL